VKTLWIKPDETRQKEGRPRPLLEVNELLEVI